MSHHSRSISKSPQSDFGLVAWLDSTRIVLPLRGVDCRFQVTGGLLGVQIDQVFHHSGAQALDCLYSFPLPAGAAVYRCEMHVNGRVIQARVEEENRARQLVAQHRAAGHRTALVEMDRENLFTLTLGNVQPGDRVVVRLAYFQTVSRLADWSSFHIPFCPGIRYIPGKPLLRSPSGKGTADDTDQVPDASRINPPRMDSDSDDVATLFVEGTVDDPCGGIRDLSSPSHPLLVRHGSQAFQMGLAEGCSLPDQDFVLRWTEVLAEELAAAAWSGTSGDDTYAMVRIMPPSVLSPTHITNTAHPETDVYFILDHSGSMAGEKWQRTAQAFVEFVAGMNSQDRVWLTLFNSEFRDFAEKPLPAAQLSRDLQSVKLASLPPDGGTDLMPALRHVIGKTREHSSSRGVTLVLITDGQIGNEQEVLGLLREHPEVTVHVLGIDTAPNDAFLKALADQHGGTWHQMHPNDDLAGTVKRLSVRLRPAALESLELSSGWESAGSLPRRIYHGQNAVLLLKQRKGVPVTPVEISGSLNGAPRKVPLMHVGKATEAVEKLWQKTRIAELLTQEQCDGAIALAKSANLICRGTAFVAWDDSQKVIISQKEVFQPSLKPNRSLRSRAAEYFCSFAKPRVQLENLSQPNYDAVDLLETVVGSPIARQFLFDDYRDIGLVNDLAVLDSLTDRDLIMLGRELLSTPWREQEVSIRSTWSRVVAQLLLWLASLPPAERKAHCLVVDSILQPFAHPRGVNDEFVYGLLTWFEATLPSSFSNRADVVLAIKELRQQLGAIH